MLHYMKEYGPSNWQRIDQFLTLVKSIVTGGEIQLDIFMKRGMIIEFIDFMLGSNSPYMQPGERRTKMGNTYGSPNFKDLIESVMFMIMHCYTSSFTPESTARPPAPEIYNVRYALEE